MSRETVEVGFHVPSHAVHRSQAARGRRPVRDRAGVAQRVQDNDSSAATPGLTATFSGKAFAPGAASQAPVMKVRDLRRGQATSGTVTVRNPGPGRATSGSPPGACPSASAPAAGA